MNIIFSFKNEKIIKYIYKKLYDALLKKFSEIWYWINKITDKLYKTSKEYN